MEIKNTLITCKKWVRPLHQKSCYVKSVSNESGPGETAIYEGIILYELP